MSAESRPDNAGATEFEPYTLMTLNGDTVSVGRVVTLAQRQAAGRILEKRVPHLTPVQRIAVVDAMAYWMGETGDDELVMALAEAVCPNDRAAAMLAGAFS
ncbi:hypothetical protein [Cryptosporangium aurantiacum]|uniref:Uncharacterized protein n=1 Tax=Cryptosporangium aurantiacum TaxID=134849 RepID=A0A1M7RKW7_9ACTN|nr:hypothetical protein [Cryptosporangium aurantiacum]SHN46914.1 hypothetical protein SAMN05443668_1199 [Cryptosporangium aurantiacum]